MARLARWIAWAEVRHSPMLHGMLAAALAWDALLLVGLDGWRRASGAAVRDWFDALADAEALVALATLAHDNPGWCFPEPIESGAPASEASLDAAALGHPLLAAGTRVTNPVRLGAPGSLLMVSGSNMAGKTTLLRAVGANVLLAQAGGPVCAEAMRWRPLRVRTSVRVHDALEAGVSLFLAELRRLRDVVAAADGAPDGAPDGTPGSAPVLFLFDEVLHGTNSHDRREATRAVLARLAGRGAVGVVTTHDLELADDPGLAPATTHVHFRERYAAADAGPRMEFDYLARPGRATTTNALALLDLLGLGR
jgi:DNA mismatch repair ATPase MutS